MMYGEAAEAEKSRQGIAFASSVHAGIKIGEANQAD
jgi:hypothetical protein